MLDSPSRKISVWSVRTFRFSFLKVPQNKRGTPWIDGCLSYRSPQGNTVSCTTLSVYVKYFKDLIQNPRKERKADAKINKFLPQFQIMAELFSNYFSINPETAGLSLAKGAENAMKTKKQQGSQPLMERSASPLGESGCKDKQINKHNPNNTGNNFQLFWKEKKTSW